MRKWLLTGAIAAVAIWIAIWVGSLLWRSSLTGGDSHRWPGDLGTLSEVPDRYPHGPMSRGAAQLLALAEPLGIDLAPRDTQLPAERRPLEFVRQQLTAWVIAQIADPTPRVEPLPSESGEYLASRGADLAAIVSLLLSNEPIVWAEDIRDPNAPLPNLLGYMALHRVLIARGLDRSRVGDAGGWDDLRASWHLAQTLSHRHEIISKLISLTIARNVSAASRKMPLPAPAWLHEMHSFDFRRSFFEAAQVDAWRLADLVHAETTIDGPPLARRAVDAVMAPYTRASFADWAEASRKVALEVASTRDCSLDSQRLGAIRNDELAWWNVIARRLPTPNLDGMWQRLLRFTPEREATVRALALRSGEPPQPQSACADGQWIYSDDGKSFRFSREIPMPGPNQIPLEFAIPRAHDAAPPRRPDSSLRSE